MKELKPHPRLALLADRFGDRATAITLNGFVGPAPEGIVRISPDLSGQMFFEIPEDKIHYSEQDDATGIAQLFIDSTTIVTVSHTLKIPIITLARQRRDDDEGGGGDKEDNCRREYDARIEECKKKDDIFERIACEDNALAIYRICKWINTDGNLAVV